jgi:hypothetical protein
VSVHIKCDRCGAMDDHHWRNLKVQIRRGMYASISAPGYSHPWELDWQLCGYCASTLQEWSNNRPVHNQDDAPASRQDS